MIITAIIGGAISSFFAYLYGKTLKEKKIAIAESGWYESQSKRLLIDLDNTKRELDRLLDRNSYLEGKLNCLIKENEQLGSKNDELSSLYSIAKEEANRIKFKMIEIEESLKPKPPAKKIRLVKKK